MNQVKVVLLTGPSCGGKSHLQKQLSVHGYRCLDNDVEVMKRSFDLMKDAGTKKYHEIIGKPEAWSEIENRVDFARLVRLHHRDWFLRNGCPSTFVAVGWMYSKQQHRDEIRKAFERIPECRTSFMIARLNPTPNEFVERYIKRQDKANESAWQNVTQKGEEARREWALARLDEYLKDHWEEPTDGTQSQDVRDFDEVLSIIRGL